MKYDISIIPFLVLLLSCNTCVADYIIDGDGVYIDDSNVYLSATPHTLSSSGWVYFNLTSKVYTGNIDAAWGFNTTVSKPTKAELYSPHWVNTTTDHQKTFYNATFIIYTGNNLNYGNSYNINYKYSITESIVNDNGTTHIISNATFDSFIKNGDDYTIYWHNRHNNYYLWKDFTPSFKSVTHDYNGFDKWYYIKNVPIISDKEYTVRTWIDIPISMKKQKGKYYFAIKPSHETIGQAISNGHFYNLDPWWNATWHSRKDIILTGGTSGAQTDYQLLLNVTYESNMQPDFDDLRFCNETHGLDAWLESKVDNSYALVWVEFPTTPANTVEQTYYMYYGNAGASSDWDIGATALFGDDFPGVTIDTTNKWDIISGTPTVNNGLYLDDGERIDTKTWTGNTVVLRLKATVPDETGSSLNSYFGLAENSANQKAEFITYWNWDVRTSDNVQEEKTTIAAYNGEHIFEIQKNTGTEVKFFVDDVLKDTDTTYVYNGGIPIRFGKTGSNALLINWVIACKYVTNPPTHTFGSEEIYESIPPTPVNLVYTTGNFWVKHTWSAGSGNVTDGYNVSVNSVWHNTTNTFYNDTYTPHAWQNITIYAFNSTGSGTLSSGNASHDTQIPNNPIIITNTSDWSGDANETVYVDYDATDEDSDTATFSCNRTDLFIDFNTVTGKGNWTATANIYCVDFGVSDGYGSVSNYSMTLTGLIIEPPSLTDEIKLILSEILTETSDINMGAYLVYAFILLGILLIILVIQIIINGIYRG